MNDKFSSEPVYAQEAPDLSIILFILAVGILILAFNCPACSPVESEVSAAVHISE